MKPWEVMCQMSRLLQGIIEEAAPDLESLGLYPRAFLLLARVNEYPYPSQLARALFLPPPTITFIVRQLERAGFVTRALDEKDLRRYRLTVTPKGEKVLASGKAVVDRSMERRLQRLTSEEQKLLSGILGTLDSDAAPMRARK